MLDYSLMHGHHNVLFSFGISEEDRMKQVDHKPTEERKLRRRLVAKVSLDKFPPELMEADQKWLEAHRKWEEADQKWEEAPQKREEADQKRLEAHRKWEEADQKYREADQKHQSTLEKLHKELCVKDCPWDGKTIFTRKDKKGVWY